MQPACPASPEADTGWFNAFRYTTETGTNLPNQPSDGAMQLIQKGNTIYFSFEINNETGTFNDNYDAVLLAFANFPPSTATPPATARYTWIVINGPFTATSGNAAQPVPNGQIVAYQSSTFGGLLNGQIPTPSWFHAGMFGEPAGASYSWWVVVSIDNSDSGGPQLPSSGQFSIYLDAIAAQSETLTDTQATLLGEPFLPATTLPLPANPQPSDWVGGSLSSGSGCTGLFVTGSDITNTVNGAPTDNISTSPSQSNNFRVKVHNSGVDAPQVFTTFKIANFGLPSPDEWQPLGFNACQAAANAAAALGQPTPSYCQSNLPWTSDFPTSNPTAPLDVPAAVSTPTGSCGDGTGNQCTTFAAGPWTLQKSNAAYYIQPENVHECVRVDLDSKVGTTTFINNSAFNNFFFSATASTFKSFPAFVSANYPKVGNGSQQTFNLKVVRRPIAGSGAQTILSRSGRQSAVAIGRDINYLEFLVKGCRLTGQTLTMPVRDASSQTSRKTLTFQNCESVGSYGYLISHEGPVDTWNYILGASGTDVSMTQSQNIADLYTLMIPQGQHAQIVATVSPTSGTPPPPSAGKFAVILDLGANFPQGSFSGSFNNGFSLNSGLEYIAASHLSVEGIFGYHHFSAKSGSSGDVYQFSADAKVYLTTGAIRPFINGGIGGYAFSPGSTYFGGNMGGGVLFTWSSHWGVQGSYNFHAVNTPSSATQFSTLQGGLRYVF